MKKVEKLIEYLFYLFIFLLPEQVRWIWHRGKLNGGPWEYGTYSLYGLDLLFLVLLVLTGVYFILVNKIKNKRSKIKITNQNSKFLLVIFLIIAFLSILWAQDKGLALYANIKLLEGILLFWIVGIINFSFTKLGIAFVSSAFIQALLGLWQFLTQSSFANKWLGMALHEPSIRGVSVVENATGRWLRAYGTLPHPNMLAFWLVGGLLILLGLAFKWAIQKRSFWKVFHPNFWLNIFIYWSWVIIVTGLFFTFSKQAWLALILGLLFFWMVMKKQPGIFYKLLATGLATIAVLSVVFWPLLMTRVSGQDRLEVKSRFERASYFKQSLQLIKKNPILGVGVGNYTLAIHHQINPNLKSWDYQPVHNIYLLILSELGVVGFLFFLGLVGTIVKKLLVFNFQFKNSQKVWPKVYSSLLFVGLIIGFFDHYLWTLYFGIMAFWLIFGLALKESKSG